MNLHDNLIPVICLGAMLIGVLFSLLYSKGDNRRNRANVVFVLGAAMLLANWLIREPDIVVVLRENIGWVLLGLVITFVKILR